MGHTNLPDQQDAVIGFTLGRLPSCRMNQCLEMQGPAAALATCRPRHFSRGSAHLLLKKAPPSLPYSSACLTGNRLEDPTEWSFTSRGATR